MKKSLLVLFAVCSASYGANADQSEDRAKCCDEKREAYAGAYIGAGLSYQHNKNDVTVSDNTADQAVASRMDRNQFPDTDHLKLNGKNNGKVGGAINFGYGKFINSYLYCGADFVLDIAGSSKSTEKNETFETTTVKNKGIMPTLAMRIGTYVPAIDSLVCARFGAAFVNATSENKAIEDLGGDSKIKIRRVAPIIGLSVEKNVWKNCAVKLEGDYRFAATKDKYVIGNADRDSGVRARFFENMKTSGYCVRLMGVYRFN